MKHLKSMTRNNKTTANRRLAKKRVQWFNEALCFLSSSVLADRFCDSKSASSPSAGTLAVILDRQHDERNNQKLY